MKKITTATALILGTFLPLLTKAQCTVNGKDVPCDQFWADFGWIFIAMGVFCVALIGFWLWMLIHMIKNEIPNKTMWIVLMFIPSINGIIPFVYYFMIKRKMDNNEVPALNLNYSQPIPSSQPMNVPVGGVCPACGSPITPEIAFCGKCGNKLK